MTPLAPWRTPDAADVRRPRAEAETERLRDEAASDAAPGHCRLRVNPGASTVTLVAGEAGGGSWPYAAWCTAVRGRDCPQTRDWGHWIRRRTSPWAQGFVRPSKRETADRVAILSDDRGEAPLLEPRGAPGVDFGTVPDADRATAAGTGDVT
ncbi:MULTISPECIES: hypothetical protein [Streptomyces]|uniref:hypothetical protein n=1 Tax=Streptomyces TaxID=1883 RepID=UPI000262E765|nr:MULTISPECIES: hypothetical protein [Streptomyces]MYS88866.1 hypothetical protein [Streptomyces sp. SID5464]